MASPFSTEAERVFDCLCAQVALMPAEVRPQNCCLFIGSDQEFLAGLDEDRCKCGTAYVRIGSITPVTIFPQAQERWIACAPDQWNLNLELGIVRCPPLGTERAPATCAEELAFTRQVMDDADAMRKAVTCCLIPSLPAGRQFIVGAWTAFGPQGMCGGGTMQLQLQVTCRTSCP